VPQIEMIVRDDKLRQTIVDNAKQFVETNYSEKVEFNEYARLASAMSRIRESKTKTDDKQSEELAESAQNLSAISEEQEHVENETLHKEPENNATEKVGDSGRAETADATKNVSSSAVKGGGTAGKKQTAARTTSNGPKKTKLIKMKAVANVVSDVAFMKQSADQRATSRTASDTGVRSLKTSSDIRAPDGEQNKPETSDVVSKPDSALQTDGKQNGEDQATKKTDVEKVAVNVATDIATAKTPSSRCGSTVRAVSIVAKKTKTAKLKAAVNVNVASSEHGSPARTVSDTVVQLQKADPDDEKNNPATCESASKPDSTTETDGKESSKTENGEDHATNKANAVEQASEEVWAKPVTDIAAETTRSPRDGAAKKSGGKPTTGSKKIPVKSTGKSTNRQTRRMSIA